MKEQVECGSEQLHTNEVRFRLFCYEEEIQLVVAEFYWRSKYDVWSSQASFFGLN